MKPFRIRMAHQLIVNYGLYRRMNCYLPHRATDAEMCAFHSPEYIQHLKQVAPHMLNKADAAAFDFKVGENDCPCFEGLYEFS